MASESKPDGLGKGSNAAATEAGFDELSLDANAGGGGTQLSDVRSTAVLEQGNLDTPADFLDAVLKENSGQHPHHATIGEKIAKEHTALRNAGREGSQNSAATPIQAGAVKTGTGATSAQTTQFQETVLSLLTAGGRKKRESSTDDAELAEFIRQHPELSGYIQQLKAAREEALRTAQDQQQSPLQSKDNLAAKLDVIATLLEGSPLAPQLRIGDTVAEDAIVYAAQEILGAEEGRILGRYLVASAESKIIASERTRLLRETAQALEKAQAEKDPIAACQTILSRTSYEDRAAIFEAYRREFKKDYKDPRAVLIEREQQRAREDQEKERIVSRAFIHDSQAVLNQSEKNQEGMLTGSFYILAGSSLNDADLALAYAKEGGRHIDRALAIKESVKKSEIDLKAALALEAEGRELESQNRLNEAQDKYNAAQLKFQGAYESVGAPRPMVYSEEYRADMQMVNAGFEASEGWYNKTEKNLRTTQKVCVIAGATIATGGAAAAGVGLFGAAAIGTGVGTGIGVASSTTEAVGQVARGNETVGEAAKKSLQRDLGYLKDSAMAAGTTAIGIGVAGKLAPAAGQPLTWGRSIAMGSTAGSVSAGSNNAINTAYGKITGTDGRSLKEIAIDFGTDVGFGAFQGSIGGGGAKIRADIGASGLSSGMKGFSVTGMQLAESGLVTGTGIAASALHGNLTSDSMIENIGMGAVSYAQGRAAVASTGAKQAPSTQQPHTPRPAVLPEGIVSSVTTFEGSSSITSSAFEGVRPLSDFNTQIVTANVVKPTVGHLDANGIVHDGASRAAVVSKSTASLSRDQAVDEMGELEAHIEDLSRRRFDADKPVSRTMADVLDESIARTNNRLLELQRQFPAELEGRTVARVAGADGETRDTRFEKSDYDSHRSFRPSRTKMVVALAAEVLAGGAAAAEAPKTFAFEEPTPIVYRMTEAEIQQQSRVEVDVMGQKIPLEMTISKKAPPIEQAPAQAKVSEKLPAQRASVISTNLSQRAEAVHLKSGGATASHQVAQQAASRAVLFTQTRVNQQQQQQQARRQEQREELRKEEEQAQKTQERVRQTRGRKVAEDLEHREKERFSLNPEKVELPRHKKHPEHQRGAAHARVGRKHIVHIIDGLGDTETLTEEET